MQSHKAQNKLLDENSGAPSSGEVGHVSAPDSAHAPSFQRRAKRREVIIVLFRYRGMRATRWLLILSSCASSVGPNTARAQQGRAWASPGGESRWVLFLACVVSIRVPVASEFTVHDPIVPARGDWGRGPAASSGCILLAGQCPFFANGSVVDVNEDEDL